jgi:MFS family permease
MFHLTNAPILPTVALYVKKLGGSDHWMTATVLTAQVVMTPVSLMAGRFCDSWGRKPVMGVAFWVLPVRIASYSLARTPSTVVYLQALDGIGAGIYGVAVAALSADVTRGKGGFNTLMGRFATALAIGGVIGPLLSGLLVEHFGFHLTFYTFSAIATLAATIFSMFVPETKPEGTRAKDRPEKPGLAPEAI